MAHADFFLWSCDDFPAMSSYVCICLWRSFINNKKKRKKVQMPKMFSSIFFQVILPLFYFQYIKKNSLCNLHNLIAFEIIITHIP